MSEDWKAKRQLHDQLGLHDPKQAIRTGSVYWCEACKSMVIEDRMNRGWHSVFNYGRKKLKYDAGGIRALAESLNQENKNIILPEMLEHPHLASCLLGVPGFDQAKVRESVAKSKIEMNAAITQLGSSGLEKMKDVVFNSSRLLYGAAVRAGIHHQWTPEEMEKAIVKISESKCYSFKFAYLIKAKRKDDRLRNSASRDSRYALKYAMFVDRCPHDVTRNGAVKDPLDALYYARKVDGRPHPATLAAVLKNPRYALEYALRVAKADVPAIRTLLKESAKEIPYNQQFYKKYIATFGDEKPTVA